MATPVLPDLCHPAEAFVRKPKSLECSEASKRAADGQFIDQPATVKLGRFHASAQIESSSVAASVPLK